MSPHNPNDQNGQTFLACDNGEVTSVSIGYIVVYPGTYELYMGIDPGVGNPLPTTPAATLVVTTEYSGIVTFNFPIPFSVLNDGTIYRFAIASPTPSFIKRHLDDYSGGSLIEPDYNPDSLYDIDFEIAIQPTSADVPTLSEWGLLILALSFMTLGTLYLLQPKFRGGIFEQER
ncbi:MAG: hypothetical protein AB8B69_21655 [Chitinophagales bacterium]